MIASRALELGVAWPAAPSMPSPPACASMSDVATGVPGARPSSARGRGREPADALAQRAHVRADAREPVVGEIAEPDLRRSTSGPSAARDRGTSTCTRSCRANARRLPVAR